MERQLYALVADDASTDAHRPNDAGALLQELKEYSHVWVYSKVNIDSSIWTLCDGNKISEADYKMPNFMEEIANDSKASPIFQNPDFSPVFHDMDRTFQVLNMVISIIQ